jgi:hypothetical protein
MQGGRAARRGQAGERLGGAEPMRRDATQRGQPASMAGLAGRGPKGRRSEAGGCFLTEFL